MTGRFLGAKMLTGAFLRCMSVGAVVDVLAVRVEGCVVSVEKWEVGMQRVTVNVKAEGGKPRADPGKARPLVQAAKFYPKTLVHAKHEFMLFAFVDICFLDGKCM